MRKLAPTSFLSNETALTNPPRLPKPASAGDLRLADFIRLNIGPIVAEWISFARTRTPASDDMTRLALQDHIHEILQFLADDIEARTD